MINKEETIKQYREKQEKYIYYLIALDVSSIAFSIYTTKDSSLNIIQIPLAIAVFFWGLSIFYGLRFIRVSLSSLFTEYLYMETKEDNRFTALNTEYKKNLIDAFRNRNDKDNKLGIRFEKIMSYSFYIGILLYITFHIL